MDTRLPQSLTRRGFIGGALATGALSLSGAALSACTPTAEAPMQADSQAAQNSRGGFGRWSWDTPPSAIPDSQIAETYDCDICVVGAGVAGIPAALYATEQGQDVVVLQKNAAIAVNGQAMGAWNHSFGTEKGIKWDTNLTVQLYANASNGKANLKLVRNYIEHSGEALDYLLSRITDPAPGFMVHAGPKGKEHIGCNWLLDGTYASRYAGFRKFNQNMADLAISLGARFLFETPARQLIKDSSGTVTGVIGENKSGQYVRVNTVKGVILCTGDVADDDEMLEAYFPIMRGRPTLHSSPCNTGDGLKMGLWIGAACDYAPAGMQLHFDPSPLSPIAPPFSAAPWLHVNVRGERFTNENQGYQALATAVTSQPEYRAFQIIDTHYIEHIAEYTNGGRGGTTEQMEAAVEAGSVLKANTLDELAASAKLPVDVFKATVARYNDMVVKGADDDYGSEIIALNGIKDPPFYAIERMPAILVAGLGLTCNEYGQVMSKEGSPIKGLYAAGNTMGSYYGYDYPVEGFGGTTIGHSITLGIMDVMHLLGTHGQKIE